MSHRPLIILAAGLVMLLGSGTGAGAAVPATAASTPALGPGRYPAYIAAIDPAKGSVTIDLVRILRDADAQKAARRAGVEFPEGYALWIENGSPRLRALRVTPDLKIDGLIQYAVCDTPARRLATQRKLSWLKAQLRRHPAYRTSPYVFWVTVRDGRIQHLHLEKLFLMPAC